METCADSQFLNGFLFLLMATLYSRIKHYADSKRKTLLNLDQRQELGKITIGFWFTEHNTASGPICRLKEIQPEGTFEVLSYPRSFIPHLDKLVAAFHSTLPPAVEKKKRKRIPVQTPAWKGGTNV